MEWCRVLWGGWGIVVVVMIMVVVVVVAVGWLPKTFTLL